MRGVLTAATLAAAALTTAAAAAAGSSATYHKVPANFNSATGQVASADGTDAAVAVLAYGTKQKAWTP